MADNVTVDNGSLTDYVVASDDVGAGVQEQLFKLSVGAGGASSPVVEGTNLPGRVPVSMPDKTAADTVDMTDDTDATAWFPLDGLGQPSVTVSGTWTGTLVIEFQDNNDAAQIGPNIYPIDPLTNTYNVLIDQAVGGTTQTWKVIGTAGCKAIRLRCIVEGTGTAEVDFRAGYAPYDFQTVAIGGDVNHGGADSGGPAKIGMKAIPFGTSPTAVDADDRTNWFANRHGIPWVLCGHMNPFRLTRKDTAAQTDTVLQSISAGQKAIVTMASIYCDKANSVDVQGLVEFDDGTDVRIVEHPGIAAGSGLVEGNGGGVVAAGADGEDVLWTCEVPTGGNITVHVTGFVIPS